MAITVSPLTGGNNAHAETAANVGALATDFFNAGVVGAITATAGVAPMTGPFAVNQESSPNMQVRVTGPSVAYVTGTPSGGVSQLFRVSMDANTDVTINANSSGSTAWDFIYIKLDPSLLANPDVNAQTVGTLVVSRSTSSASDNGTPPTYGYNIARVTVANGASSIANASITDKRIQTGAVALSAVPGGINFAGLLSTIFSGQVNTQVNAGGGGGNLWWVNLGGIKIMWGTSSAQTVNTNTSFAFTLPAFFTTVQTCLNANQSANNLNYSFVVSYSTSAVTLQVQSTTSITATASFLLIGT